MADGTLYPLLAVLWREGLVEAWPDASGAGRTVRVYALRQRGREELARLRQAWEREVTGVQTLIARMGP